MNWSRVDFRTRRSLGLPTDSLPGIEVSETVTVTWDGEPAATAGRRMTSIHSQPIRVEFVNLTSEYRRFSGYHDSSFDFGTELSTLVRPMARNTGYLTLSQGRYELGCEPDIRGDSSDEEHVAAILTVRSP